MFKVSWNEVAPSTTGGEIHYHKKQYVLYEEGANELKAKLLLMADLW